MPTDTERREVARRLREIRPCKSGHIKWWEIAKALGLKQPAGWFGWEKFEPDSAHRLADLIEPSEPKVRCVAEVKIDGEKLEELANDVIVNYEPMPDMDALLALADEMYEFGSLPAKHPGVRVMHNEDFSRELGYARRIREALGVVE